jgi:hypothetical protein
MIEAKRPIREWTDVTAERFASEIVPASEPAVLRGLVSHWPAVAAGRAGMTEISSYLRRFDQGASVATMQGPPSIKGRFFYNDDLSAFNFQKGATKISSALDYLLSHADDAPAPAFAVQSVQTRANLPGFEEENPLPLAAGVEPRIWFGNASIVAAHHDPSENIACVVAGNRRFTLFPPSAIGHLYIGPFELTPAGASISMVDFDAPDLDRFPRFPEAMEAAYFADLAPGDAIYIPYLWWHHVRARDTFNMLVNYWWEAVDKVYGAPRDVLVLAMMSLRALPEAQRQAWREIFEHYVFRADADAAGAHLPQERRGILGKLDAATLKALRSELGRKLMRS